MVPPSWTAPDQAAREPRTSMAPSDCRGLLLAGREPASNARGRGLLRALAVLISCWTATTRSPPLQRAGRAVRLLCLVDERMSIARPEDLDVLIRAPAHPQSSARRGVRRLIDLPGGITRRTVRTWVRGSGRGCRCPVAAFGQRNRAGRRAASTQPSSEADLARPRRPQRAEQAAAHGSAPATARLTENTTALLRPPRRPPLDLPPHHGGHTRARGALCRAGSTTGAAPARRTVRSWPSS